MGQALSRSSTKKKIADLQRQLKESQASGGKASDDLKAKDQALQSAKTENTAAQAQIKGLQSSRDAEAKQRKDLEDRTAALTKERDQAKHDADNSEIRAKAAEYQHQRASRDLEAAKESSSSGSTGGVAAGSAAAGAVGGAAAGAAATYAAEREASDKQRRDLEDKVSSLTKERDQAKSDHDRSEINSRSLVYAHNREKKALSEQAEREKDGIRQEGDALRLQKHHLLNSYNDISGSKKAHEALLRYHEHAKNDWRDLLLQAQLEIEALRLQKAAYKKAYDEAYQYKYRSDALLLQKKHLMAAYESKSESERKLHHLRQNHRELSRDLDKHQDKLAGANSEIAATRSLHKDTSDFHNLTSKQLDASNKELADTKDAHSKLLSAHETLKNDAAKKYSAQEEDHAITRGKLDDLNKKHLDQASQLDQAKSSLTKAQSDKTDLESQVKTLSTEKEAHRQTGLELANQLSASKANIARLEKEASDRRDSGMKIDSPLLQNGSAASNAVSYNVNNL